MNSLTNLAPIINSIGAATKYETLVHTSIHGIAKALQANTCSFMRYDNNKKVLKIDAAMGIDREIVRNTAIRSGERIAGWVLDHQEPLLLVDKANPSNYISQPMIGLSVCPTLTEAAVEPRHVDLRPYAVTGEETWLLPGGLTRVALKRGSIVVNSSQGGGTKDTWVLREDGA